MASQPLRDLTRTCILGGLPSAKWEGLVRQWTARNTLNPPEVSDQIWSALRPLFTTHSSEAVLADYVTIALSSNLLPLHKLVLGLLTKPLVGSTTPSLAELIILDTLVQRALFTLLARGPPPQRMIIVPTEASLQTVVECTHNAIDLVKIAFSLPPEALVGTPPLSSTLPGNAATLLVQVLNSIGRAEALTSADAGLLYTHINDIAHFQLPSTMSQELLGWSNSLSFVAFHGSALDHQELFAAPAVSPPALYGPTTSGSGGAADDLPPLPEGAELACSMCVFRLVTVTPGSGDLTNATSELLALYRTVELNAGVFFRALFLASLRLVAHSLQKPSWGARSSARILSFVLGRLPFILKTMDGIVSQGTQVDDFRVALSSSLATVLSDRTLVTSCAGSKPSLNEKMTSNETHDLSFAHRFVYSMAINGLLKDDHATLVALVPNFPVDRFELDKLATTALDEGLTVEEYISARLDSGSDDVWTNLVAEVEVSYSSHSAVVELLSKRLNAANVTGDLQQMAQLSRLLHSDMRLLDILALHTPIAPLVYHALDSLSRIDFGSHNDAQSALCQYGHVILFIQIASRRFKLASSRKDPSLMFPVSSPVPMSALSSEDREAARRWKHSLFSPDSEGIDDELLRNTEPRNVLRLAPIILVDALRGLGGPEDSTNRDALLSGASYYVGDLLSWTLPSALLALVAAVHREGATAAVHLDALHQLTTSSGCPPAALQISGFSILRLLATEFVQKIATETQCNLAAIREKVHQAIGSTDTADNVSLVTTTTSHVDSPRLLIHSLLMAPSNTSTSPRLQQILLFPPNVVLSALFHELNNLLPHSGHNSNSPLPKSALVTAATLLTSSRSGAGSSLLPYTLKVFVPTVLASRLDASGPSLDLDTLALVVGSSVVSLRILHQARGVVSAHLSRGAKPSETDETKPRAEDVDQRVASFVRWLELPKTSPYRAQLLEKLRSRPEFAGHFVLG